MKVIPAIDLWDGSVVRFVRGDPHLSKVYSPDPAAVAQQWEAQGAELLHLVDLSAALGQGDNLPAIKQILAAIKIPVEIGGGVRSLERAQELLALGGERVIIGTKAREEKFLRQLLTTLGPERLIIGIDVINSCVAVEGWKIKTSLRQEDLVRFLEGQGIKWIIYTDISRDGTLSGPNIEGVREFAALAGVNFIASGGVSCLDDLKQLKEQAPFVWGVIVGKALYEKKFTLPQAREILK